MHLGKWVELENTMGFYHGKCQVQTSRVWAYVDLGTEGIARSFLSFVGPIGLGKIIMQDLQH